MRRFYAWVFVMPKGLKRYYGRGDLHFLTFSCYRRLPLLDTVQTRNVFVQALGKIRERYKFLLVGYVVMPNPVHLLIRESSKATPSVVLKVLKQCVSRDLRKQMCQAPRGQLRFTSIRGDGKPPCYWQPRFYDFNVWSKRKKSTKNSNTCMRTRLSGNLSIIRGTGRGAVGRFIRKERPVWSRSILWGCRNHEGKTPHATPACGPPKFVSRFIVRATRPSEWQEASSPPSTNLSGLS